MPRHVYPNGQISFLLGRTRHYNRHDVTNENVLNCLPSDAAREEYEHPKADYYSDHNSKTNDYDHSCGSENMRIMNDVENHTENDIKSHIRMKNFHTENHTAI